MQSVVVCFCRYFRVNYSSGCGHPLHHEKEKFNTMLLLIYQNAMFVLPCYYFSPFIKSHLQFFPFLCFLCWIWFDLSECRIIHSGSSLHDVFVWNGQLLRPHPIYSFYIVEHNVCIPHLYWILYCVCRRLRMSSIWFCQVSIGESVVKIHFDVCLLILF